MSVWIPPFAAAGFVMAGSLKSSDQLSWLPVDLTVLLAGLTLFLMLLRAISGVSGGTVLAALGFGLLAIPILWTPATGYADSKVSRLFTLTFLAILAPTLLIRSVREAERLFIAWVAMSTLVVGGAILNPRAVSDYAGAAIASDSTNTIELGRAGCLVVLVMVLGLIWRRIPWLVAAPLIGASLYVALRSGSRGPLLATALAILASLLFGRAKPRRLRSTSVLVLGGLLVYNLYGFAPLYARERISTVLNGQVVGDTQTRVDLYKLASKSVAQHPTGLGWGGFESIAFLGYRYPHNLVLEVLCEGGVFVGGLFLLWLLGMLLTARNLGLGFLGASTFSATVFFFVNSLVSGDLNDNRGLFFAIGIALALRSHSRAAREAGSLAPDLPPPRGPLSSGVVTPLTSAALARRRTRTAAREAT